MSTPRCEPSGAGRVVELRAEGLVVRFGARTVLDGVDLAAPAGSWTTIGGASGAGKSVLLGALAGVVAPTAGSVLLDGRPPTVGPAAVSVALVDQDCVLVPYLTAAESVAVPLQARRLTRAEIRRRTVRWLEAFGLAGAARQLTTELSGGQCQRVALARALALEAPALLLDEPTAALDAANRDVVIDVVRERADAGAVVVVVSHDPAVAERTDRAVTLDAGRATVGAPRW